MLKLFKIPYGKELIELEFQANLDVNLILPTNHPALGDPEAAVTNALKNPIDLIDLHEFAAGKTVGIAVNDPTRPVPHSILIPPLLNELEKFGIAREDILFFIATGTHAPLKKEEFIHILPNDITENYQLVVHDCDDTKNLVFLGTTSLKSPVYINKKYYEADIKIVVGNIEPHHFQGFSGGAKSAAIGLAGRSTININHSHLMDPLSRIGNYDSNPTRQDVEEIGDMIRITAALNVVLNIDKEIVQIFWGTPKGVMKAGIPVSRKVCQTKIDRKYDLVIATPGGYPKDINLYQSQKALTHASLIAKEHGIIILAAECREGLGSKLFEENMDGLSSFQEVINKFKASEFRVGPHKAYQLALQGSRNEIILVSDMAPSTVKKTLLTHANNLQAAIDIALPFIPKNPSIAILPYATNTIPL